MAWHGRASNIWYCINIIRMHNAHDSLNVHQLKQIHFKPFILLLFFLPFFFHFSSTFVPFFKFHCFVQCTNDSADETNQSHNLEKS